MARCRLTWHVPAVNGWEDQNEDSEPVGMPGGGVGFRGSRRGTRARRLSKPRHSLHRRIRRRRRQRSVRPLGGAEVPGEYRRHGHRREQAGRRWADFLRLRGASGARRVHGLGRRHRADGDRRRHLSQSHLSSDQELHSAQYDRLVPADAGGAGEPSGQEREGTSGLGQGPPRQVELRHFGAALHHRQRAVKTKNRHAWSGHPVQGHQRVRICAWPANSACSPFPTAGQRFRW